MRFVLPTSSVSVLGVLSNHCNPVMWNREFFIKFCSNTEHSASKFYDKIKKPFMMKT